MAMRRRFQRPERGPQIRINHRIRVPEVRVVDHDGTMLGVLSTQDALRRAREAGLDLVEVNPKAVPPVCKILDFGKFKYEEKKKQREAKKKTTVVEVKEVKLRPKTDDHDLNVKLRNARRFLEAGDKVKFVCRFRGREIMHPERAKMQHDWLVERLDDLGIVEARPLIEARAMIMIVAPRPQVLQRAQAARAERARLEVERRAAAKAAGIELPPEPEEQEDEDLELEHDPDDDEDDDDDEGGDEGDEGGEE